MAPYSSNNYYCSLSQKFLVFCLSLSSFSFGKLINITVDNASDRIIYTPPDPWQQQTGVATATDGTLAVTDVTDIQLTITLNFIGSAVYVVGNNSASVQAFFPEVDGRDVLDTPVLGNSSDGDSQIVPYWGIGGLQGNVTHELNLSLIPDFTHNGKIRMRDVGSTQRPFFLDAIIYTQESADDVPDSSSISSTASVSATDTSETDAITLPSSTSMTSADLNGPQTLSDEIIGGIIAAGVGVVVIVIMTIYLVVRRRRSRGVQVRRESILSSSGCRGDMECAVGNLSEVLPRPFSETETVSTSSATSAVSKTQYPSDGGDQLLQEMMELRAEIMKLRTRQSTQPSTAYGPGAAIAPPEYEPQDNTVAR